MKKIMFFFILILFIFANCKNQIKTINILTDDISIYEIVDKFNLENNDFKVYVDFYNKKLEQENIYKYILKNKIINYDIIIGDNNYDLILDSKHFSKITNYIKSLNKDENNRFYKSFLDFIKKYDGYAILYNINFPLIIARKDSLNKDYENKKDLSIEEFPKIASSINQFKPDTHYIETKLGFIPSVSNLNEIDFYLIFNSSLIKKNNKFSFDTQESRSAFKFFNEYDNEYNFGKDETLKYIKKFSNIEKKFFLKQKVISFDFINISNAFSFTNDLYKIFLIKDLKYISLNNKILTILKKSINKKEAAHFIDYLLTNNTQELLLKNTLKKIDYYSYIYIPVIKGIINKLDNISIFTKTAELEQYIDKLEYSDFYNNRLQNKFFENYFKIKELINKGSLNEKDFLVNISNELNK